MLASPPCRILSILMEIPMGSFKLVDSSGKDVRFLHIFLSLLLMMLWIMQHSLVLPSLPPIRSILF
jgi:hypothetical protein